MVLCQQGSCVHLGEVRQSISCQVLSIGQDQCHPEQDLEISTVMDETIVEVWKRL
jgi:hypothetical protein